MPRAGQARRALVAEVERLAEETRLFDRLDDAVRALVGGADLPEGLATHALFEGGIPRIRPLLVVLAAQADAEVPAGTPPGSRREDGTLEVAAIAEMLQLSIALHDAALGPRDGRRRRAARKVLRGASSWLGASHLTLRALEVARRAPSPDILGEALDALRDLSEGHALGERLRTDTVTPDDVLHHAETHAGVVFAFACRAGGRLAGRPRSDLTALGRYGRHLGVAWQLAEDLALFERGGDELSRAVASGRPLAPVAYAVAAGCVDLEKRWRELAERAPSVDSLRRLEADVRAAGGLAATREAMVARSWAARQALANVREGRARESMERLAGCLAR